MTAWNGVGEALRKDTNSFARSTAEVVDMFARVDRDRVWIRCKCCVSNLDLRMRRVWWSSRFEIEMARERKLDVCDLHNNNYCTSLSLMSKVLE